MSTAATTGLSPSMRLVGSGCFHCGCRCGGAAQNEGMVDPSASNNDPLGAAAAEVATLFEDFMEFGSVGLHIVDNHGTILWANKAELDLLGYSEAEYVGQPIMKFHADQNCVQEILTTLLAGKRVENYIAPITCRDGHIEYVQINSSMRQVNGKCVTTRCFSACVTDKVLREQAVLQALAKEKEAQLIKEQAKRKTDFLRSLCHELRNPLNGIAGNLDLLLGELQELQWELQGAYDAVQAQNTKNQEYQDVEHGDQQPRPATKYELREEGQGIVQNLFSGDSIDKVPPSIVPPPASVLLLARAPPEAPIDASTAPQKISQPQCAKMAVTHRRLRYALDYAKSAQLAAEHQMLVINDTLSLSRLESDKGQLDFSPKPVDVKALIASVTAILGVKAREKRVALQVETFPTNAAMAVRTDPVWFKQILINLISNAIKFVDSEHGKVRVEVHKEQDDNKQVALQVSVQDNGIGMTQQEQAKLFGCFQQANEKISAQFGGSGLGLHIVKQLLDHVGGSIRLESAKGKRTTFWFSLPCGPPLEAQELAKLQQQPSRPTNLCQCSNGSSSNKDQHKKKQRLQQAIKEVESIKVLVVDDSHINLKILSNFLRKRGYSHELAENGQIALEKFQTSRYDIVLTDIQMPEMDGLEMTRNIRKHEKEKQQQQREPASAIPIIGISGNVLPEDAATAKQVGMNEYLGKPYRFADLEALMRKHLSLS